MEIHQMINDIRSKIVGKELTPVEASNHLTSLSALYGNVVLKVVEDEHLYNTLLNTFLLKDDTITSTRATQMAKATKEYKDFQTAKAYAVMTIELIRGLKLRIKLLEHEAYSAKNL